jgi:hypothetical protein
VSESFIVTCPYCAEEIELYLESDIQGDLVQDCEVCCNPWLVRIFGDEGDREVQITRADGSE